MVCVVGKEKGRNGEEMERERERGKSFSPSPKSDRGFNSFKVCGLFCFKEKATAIFAGRLWSIG